MPSAGPTTIRHLQFVTDDFLPAAVKSGIVTGEQAVRIELFARHRRFEGFGPGDQGAPEAAVRAAPTTHAPAQAMTVAPAVVEPVGRPGPTLAATTAQPAAPSPAAPTARPTPKPRQPSRLSLWWTRTRESIGSDLAAHGLAYLGVLLLFVGGFGLVAFAFGGVSRGLRPVAELALALLPFGAAWLLLHRGVTIAGRAVELAGGLLLPIMIITSFLDGVAFPPDLRGSALVVATTSAIALVSVGYALWSVRHPASMLRFLIAPALWLAAGLATMGVGRAIPTGRGVASITAAQTAAMTAAMLVTLAVTRLRALRRFAASTATASVVGGIVLLLLAGLTWVKESFPVGPVWVTGLCGLVILELLSARLTRQVVAVASPLWWAAVSLALVPGLGTVQASAVGVAGFVALLERHSTDPQPALPFAIGFLGAGVAAAGTVSDPWWSFAVFTALTCWAEVRRLHPFALPRSGPWHDLVAGALPLASIALLGRALDNPPIAVLIASVLALTAVYPARWPRPQSWWLRYDGDNFWTKWWAVATASSTIALIGYAASDWNHPTAISWMLVVSAFVLTASLATGPMPPLVRSWLCTAAPVATWLLLSRSLEFTRGTVAVGVGVIAVLGVLLAHLLPSNSESWMDRAHLGLARQVVALGAIGIAWDQAAWVLTTTCLLATGAWLFTAVLAELGRSPVSARLESWASGLRYLPSALTAIGVPASAALVLDASGTLALGSTWSGTVLAVTAVVYSAAIWIRVGDTWRRTLAWAAPVAAVAATVAASTPWPAVAGLAAIVAVAAITPADLRPRGVPWLGWAAVVPLAGLTASQLWFAGTSSELLAAWVAVTGGAFLVILASGADLLGRGWVPVLRPTRSGWLPPFVLGSMELAVGVALTPSQLTHTEAGLVLLGAAIAALTASVLMRSGLVLGIGLALGWATTLTLGSGGFASSWWLAAAVAAVLWALAETAHAMTRDTRWWVRSDLPVAVMAHVTAVTSLAVCADRQQFEFSLLTLGVLSMGAAVRLARTRTVSAAYGGLGSVFLLVSAGLTGNAGWIALALAFESLVTTVLAAWTKGVARSVLLVVGSGMTLASWLYLVAWLDWPHSQVVDVTAGVAALVALGCALAYRFGRADEAAFLVRGGLSAATASLAPFVSWAALLRSGGNESFTVILTWWTVAALAVTSLAVSTVADRAHRPWLRDVTVVGLAGAAAEALAVVSATEWTQLVVAAVVAVAADVAVVALCRVQRGNIWLQPAQLASGLATVAGLMVAIAAQPMHGLLPVALAAAAATAASETVATKSLAPRIITPLLACLAWMAFAVESLDARPQWLTIPFGLALAIVADLIRAWKHEHGQPGVGEAIAALDLVAVLFLAGYGFVRAFSGDLVWTLLPAAAGIGVAYWGVFTKVRRRVLAGVTTVLAALAVLVLVPLAQVLPQWTGVALWISIAAIGLLAIVGATLLERGRTVVHHAMDDFRRRTKGWE